MAEHKPNPGLREVLRVTPGTVPGTAIGLTGLPEPLGTEQQVFDALSRRGYDVAQKHGVVCVPPDADGRAFVLSPDIVLKQHRLAVEVDPCQPNSYTHLGNEDMDRWRNDQLAQVGWTVIRLRLFAEQDMDLGDRDVLVQAYRFTYPAEEALVEAIEDFIAGRPAQVRRVRWERCGKTLRSNGLSCGLSKGHRGNCASNRQGKRRKW